MSPFLCNTPYNMKIKNITFKIVNSASSIFSNFTSSCDFGGNSVNVLGNNPITVSLDCRINTSNYDPNSNGSNIDIYADVTPNITFGPAPVITITSATIVDQNYSIEATPTTIPIDGQNITVN